MNGLQIPVANPQPMARTLIPSPVNASHPMDTARATAMGTNGTLSSKEPTKEPMHMKNRVTTKSILYFLVSYLCRMA